MTVAAFAAETLAALEGRPDADLHPRAVESIALENTGTSHQRRSSIVVRARLAARAARSRDRRDRFTYRPNRAERRAAARLRRKSGR